MSPLASIAFLLAMILVTYIWFVESINRHRHHDDDDDET